MTLDELVERAVFLANSLDRSVHPDADVISAMASQILAMKGALEGVRSFLASAPLESGYCCCGSPVEGHGFGDGHSPVDELQYAAHNQIDRALRLPIELMKYFDVIVRRSDAEQRYRYSPIGRRTG